MVKVTLVSGRLYISGDVYDHKDALKKMGAMWNPRLMAWSVAASPIGMCELDDWFRGIEDINPLYSDDVVSLLADGRRRLQALQVKDMATLPDIPISREAWEWQRQAYWFAMYGKLDGVGLFIDMGGGKTGTAIALLDGWNASSAIILAPKNVVGVWPNEFLENAEDPSQWDVIVPPTKLTVPKRVEYARKHVELARRRGRKWALVVNHDAAWRKPMGEFLLSLEATVSVVDESHKAKSAGGKLSTFLSQLGRRSEKRIIMTGTPMPHGREDLYAQYRFVDPTVFGTSYTAFKNRFTVEQEVQMSRKSKATIEAKRQAALKAGKKPPNMGAPKTIVGYKNDDDFTALMASISYSKELQYGEMPPTHEYRSFDLSTRARRAYDALDKDMMLEIATDLEEYGGEPAEVTVQNVLTKLLRLQQITSGFLKDDEGYEHIIADDKISLLGDTLDTEIEDLRMPVVVYARFQTDLQRISELAEEQGRRYGEVSGRRQSRVTPGLTTSSKMRPDIDLVGVQLQAGGVGIDLTRSNLGVFYSMDYNLGNYKQLLRRQDRPGQKRHVTYLHLVAANSQDMVVYEALKRRDDGVRAVIEMARRYRG